MRLFRERGRCSILFDALREATANEIQAAAALAVTAFLIVLRISFALISSCFFNSQRFVFVWILCVKNFQAKLITVIKIEEFKANAVHLRLKVDCLLGDLCWLPLLVVAVWLIACNRHFWQLEMQVTNMCLCKFHFFDEIYAFRTGQFMCHRAHDFAIWFIDANPFEIFTQAIFVLSLENIYGSRAP